MLVQLHQQPQDDIFFSKRDLRVGTAIRYWGRRNPGSLWFVTGVFTADRVPRKEVFAKNLSDLIRLKNHITGEVRFRSFGYLSYSAIYRIDDD
jgi:hypothetical protein